MSYTHKIRSILLTTLFLGSISAACYAEELRTPSFDHVLEKVKTIYGINLHYAEGPTSKFIDLDYSLADSKNNQALKKAILLFIREISLYPKNFFRSAHCQDVYFVQRLFYKQNPVDGLFSLGTNFIFYDYSRRSNNTPMVRHYIHHELYHMIGSKHPFWKEHNTEWEALNRIGFAYNQKYSPPGRNPINFYAPSEPGFTTDYAMTSAEEDKAEVFACIMIPEELKLMEQWAKKDKILFKKIEMMREFLRGTF
jgi:hypothetical protein